MGDGAQASDAPEAPAQAVKSVCVCVCWVFTLCLEDGRGQESRATWLVVREVGGVSRSLDLQYAVTWGWLLVCCGVQAVTFEGMVSMC